MSDGKTHTDSRRSLLEVQNRTEPDECEKGGENVTCGQCHLDYAKELAYQCFDCCIAPLSACGKYAKSTSSASEPCKATSEPMTLTSEPTASTSKLYRSTSGPSKSTPEICAQISDLSKLTSKLNEPTSDPPKSTTELSEPTSDAPLPTSEDYKPTMEKSTSTTDLCQPTWEPLKSPPEATKSTSKSSNFEERPEFSDETQQVNQLASCSNVQDSNNTKDDKVASTETETLNEISSVLKDFKQSSCTYYCVTCINSHAKQNHTIVETNGSKAAICEVHTMICELFCHTCDCCICLKCIPEHKDHSFVNLSDKKESLKKDALEIIAQLLRSKIALTAHVRDVESETKRWHEDIKAQTDCVSGMFDQLKKSVLDQLRQTSSYSDVSALHSWLSRTIEHVRKLEVNIGEIVMTPVSFQEQLNRVRSARSNYKQIEEIQQKFDAQNIVYNPFQDPDSETLEKITKQFSIELKKSFVPTNLKRFELKFQKIANQTQFSTFSPEFICYIANFKPHFYELRSIPTTRGSNPTTTNKPKFNNWVYTSMIKIKPNLKNPNLHEPTVSFTASGYPATTEVTIWDHCFNSLALEPVEMERKCWNFEVSYITVSGMHDLGLWFIVTFTNGTYFIMDTVETQTRDECLYKNKFEHPIFPYLNNIGHLNNLHWCYWANGSINFSHDTTLTVENFQVKNIIFHQWCSAKFIFINGDNEIVIVNKMRFTVTRIPFDCHGFDNVDQVSFVNENNFAIWDFSRNRSALFEEVFSPEVKEGKSDKDGQDSQDGSSQWVLTKRATWDNNVGDDKCVLFDCPFAKWVHGNVQMMIVVRLACRNNMCRTEKCALIV